MNPVRPTPDLASPNGAASADPQQAGLIARAVAAFDRAEGYTWMVIVAVYGGIFALLSATSWLPLWLVCPVLAIFGGWHAHLQHELIHGHPTRSELVNDLLGAMPVSLLYPYSVFKRCHLAHHLSDLTNPMDDPESCYVMPERWQTFGRVRRAILIANNTLLGRFAIGPALTVLAVINEEGSRLIRGEREAWIDWSVHGLLVVAFLMAVEAISGIPAWLYAGAVAYPAVGLMKVRSFLEHRPTEGDVEDDAARTAIVEANWFWSLLFLNNNLHVVHHDRAGEPWYRLPRIYREQREAILQRNGGYLFNGYSDVARRFMFTPKDRPEYPGTK